MNILRIDNGKPNHTVVTVRIPGRYFPAFACSCGAMSEDFPSFRPENKCVVCSGNGTEFSIALDDWLCITCADNLNAYLELYPKISSALDFLREKISNGS